MHPTRPPSARQTSIVLLTAVAATLTGCTAEYHGYDSGIDDVLWRQIASFEDPLSAGIYDPLDETIGIAHTLVPDEYPAPVDDPATYLAGIPAPRWNGSPDALPQLELRDGGAILYDVASVSRTASFSIFIASGPRALPATTNSHISHGPSEVYTCYQIDVDFDSELPPTADRTVLPACPPALVGQLARDAAFASAEVFDG